MLDRAYRDGDLGSGRSGPIRRLFRIIKQLAPPGVGDSPLEYAIYHSPIELIAKLLGLGADPPHDGRVGFPPLIAELSADRDT